MITNLTDRINTMFSDLDFDSRRHLYFVNGESYPSVSSLVEAHSPKFDVEKMLPWSAKKANMEVDELRVKWKLTNEEACTLGTNTHNFLENYTGIETPSTSQEKAGVKFIRDMTPDWNILVRELRGYSRLYKYAGTMDLPLQHKKTKEIVIADYKTNGDLFKAYNNLHPPFEFLESSPYNKYQLQLSYYQILLNGIGLYISKRILVHLKNDGTYKIYELQDFTEDLKKHMTKVISIDNDKQNYLEVSGW